MCLEHGEENKVRCNGRQHSSCGVTGSVVMELTARKCKGHGEVNKAKDVMKENVEDMELYTLLAWAQEPRRASGTET